MLYARSAFTPQVTNHIHLFTRAAPLPTMLPPSLELIDMNNNNFKGGIPAEWSSLANLKTLNMAECGLDGPIPVELLRWKFAEGRTVELKGNAGLELPSNIGELGDSVTQIDLSGHNLRGELESSTPFNSASSEMRSRAQDPSRSSFCAGSSSSAAQFS